MNQIKLTSLIVLANILLFACNSAPTQNETVTENVSNTELIFDGTVTKLDLGDGHFLYQVEKNGNLTEEGMIKNGNKNGIWTTYQRKGLVENINSYKEGILHGPSYIVNNYGNVLERSFYINGLLEGKKIKYNRHNTKADENYVNGQLHGKRTLFYDNGKKQEEGTFVNGKREGLTKWYNEDEEVTIEYSYKDGKRLK